MKGDRTMKNLPELKFDLTDWLIFAMMAACIVTDIKSRRIYNKILIPCLIIGLSVNFAGGGWPGLLNGVKGFFMGLMLLIIPFAKGGVGGGDVKLLAVIGGIKGPAFVLSTFLAGAVAGGIMATALLIRHRRLLTTLTAGLAAASNLLVRYGFPVGARGSHRHESADPLHLPYSLAVAAGVLASYGSAMESLGR